jgi:hypothetical protein
MHERGVIEPGAPAGESPAGKNVVIIQGFKEYCALGFFQGALLKDPKKLLVQLGQVRAARAVRSHLVRSDPALKLAQDRIQTHAPLVRSRGPMGDEIRALEKALASRRPQAHDYLFLSERAGRMTRSAFRRIVAQAGRRAGLPVYA